MPISISFNIMSAGKEKMKETGVPHVVLDAPRHEERVVTVQLAEFSVEELREAGRRPRRSPWYQGAGTSGSGLRWPRAGKEAVGDSPSPT